MVVKYSRSGKHHLLNLVKVSGSVFPSSFYIAFPCAILSAVLRYLADNTSFFEDYLGKEDSVLSDSQAFSGFTFLVGFLVVFRTSEAYGRFWNGCQLIHRMRSEWFDAASATFAFLHYSRTDPAEVRRFKHTLVRLFSLLHTATIAALDNEDEVDGENPRTFDYGVLDPLGLDVNTLESFRRSHHKVELVFGWIQGVIVGDIRTNVLSIPPPILSRVFQQLGNGIVSFQEAHMISVIPFPFPYAQATDCLLVLHWCLVPVVTTQWVSSVFWCAVFVFAQVFMFWNLNLIAVEIEHPFGHDTNDLDGKALQKDFNSQLILLLMEDASRLPSLSEGLKQDIYMPRGAFHGMDAVSLNASFQALGTRTSSNMKVPTPSHVTLHGTRTSLVEGPISKDDLDMSRRYIPTSDMALMARREQDLGISQEERAEEHWREAHGKVAVLSRLGLPMAREEKLIGRASNDEGYSGGSAASSTSEMTEQKVLETVAKRKAEQGIASMAGSPVTTDSRPRTRISKKVPKGSKRHDGAAIFGERDIDEMSVRVMSNPAETE